MVATRRKIAKATRELSEARITRDEGEFGDTIHVQRPRNSKLIYVPSTSDPPTTAVTETSSSTSGMEDISLTSPSVGESVIQETKRISKRKRAPSVPDRTLSSALRRLVAKPGTNAAPGTSKGSVNNPIVLEEYSPRRKPAPLPPRTQSLYEPHKFQDRHRKLYIYRPPRPALAPKPAQGNTFTGDRGNDFYRMMNAKATATGCPPPPLQGLAIYGVPFEVQYPKSAHYLTHQPTPQPPYHSPYATYHSQMGVTLHGDTEDTLRKRALHLIRDSTRLKKLLSSDPDETSASESERPRKLVVYHDPSDLLSPLVAQSSVLGQLLQGYETSDDQEGLREDIGMLVKAQSRGVAAWIKVEDRKVKRGRGRRVEEGRGKEDEEVRGLLSAGAGMWQDGSTVVDVFGGEGQGKEGEVMVDGERRKGVCGWQMVM